MIILEKNTIKKCFVHTTYTEARDVLLNVKFNLWNFDFYFKRGLPMSDWVQHLNEKKA